MSRKKNKKRKPQTSEFDIELPAVPIVHRKRCACGYKIRGKGHELGDHHKKGKR